MDLFKKHIDAIIVIGALFSGFLWMNGQFNSIKQDIAVVKAVLIMKNIMPADCMAREEKK